MQIEKISLKDVFAKMSSVEGIASEIIKLAPVITQAEKDIIRLQEADKQMSDRIKNVEDGQSAMQKDAKADRRTDQYILVAIGVAAIGAQVLLPILLK